MGVIDTKTASDELIFNILLSLAQFERRLIQERTRDGLSYLQHELVGVLKEESLFSLMTLQLQEDFDL